MATVSRCVIALRKTARWARFARRGVTNGGQGHLPGAIRSEQRGQRRAGDAAVLIGDTCEILQQLRGCGRCSGREQDRHVACALPRAGDVDPLGELIGPQSSTMGSSNSSRSR